MPGVGGQKGEVEVAEGVRVLWQQQRGLVWVSKAIVRQPGPWGRGSKRGREWGVRGGTVPSL